MRTPADRSQYAQHSSVTEQAGTALMTEWKEGGAAKTTQAVSVPQGPCQLQVYNPKDKTNNCILIFLGDCCIFAPHISNFDLSISNS